MPHKTHTHAHSTTHRPLPGIEPWTVEGITAWAKQKVSDLEKAASAGMFCKLLCSQR